MERTDTSADSAADGTLGRRRVWTLAAGAAAAAAGLAATDAVTPAAAATTGSRQLTRIVDERLRAFSTRLLGTVLPQAVAASGPLRTALDARYLRVDSTTAVSLAGSTVVLTQRAYDALTHPDPATLYLIVD